MPRTSSRTSPGSSSRSRGCGDAVAVNTSSRYALLGDPGAGGARHSADADRRQPGRDQVLLVHDRRSGVACAGRFRAPATPAKTVSRCSCRRRRPSVSGTRFSQPAARPAWFRPASARATRCGSRRRCGCTATTWTKRRRSLEADLGWIVGWKKDDVHRRRRAAPAEGGRRAPRKLIGFEVLDRGHRASRLRRLRERREGRRRHQRHADAVPQEGDRHGVPAGRAARAPAPSSRSTSGAAALRAQVVPMPFYKRR